MDAIPGLLSNGTPTLQIRIAGVFAASTTAKFEAIIDTGFSGFVCMPLIRAFPLGLPLFGSTTVTLADGKNQDKLTALGLVTLGPHTKQGVVILEPSSNEVLIGMDFLRTFERALFLTSQGLLLLHESELTKYSQQAQGSHTSSSTTEDASGPMIDDSTHSPE